VDGQIPDHAQAQERLPPLVLDERFLAAPGLRLEGHGDGRRIDFLAVAGSRLAQGDNNPGPDLDTPVKKPQVVIKRPRTAAGGDVPDALARASTELGPLLLPCYRKALEMRPSLRGTLVLGIKLGPDGSVEELRTELSSLGDEALATCAAAKVGKAKLAAGSGRLSVTVVFGSRDDD